MLDASSNIYDSPQSKENPVAVLPSLCIGLPLHWALT